MGFGSHYVTFPGWCFSTEDYYEWVNEHCHDVHDGKLIPDWFFYLIVMNVKNKENL